MADEKLVGRVLRYRYQNADKSWSVAAVQTLTANAAGKWTEKGDDIVVVGDFGDTKIFETMEFWGKWVTNPQYGRQLDLSAVLPIETASTDALSEWLAGGHVRGLGPVLAGRIVEELGESINDILDSADLTRLAAVRGVGDEMALRIKGLWHDQTAFRRVFTFFVKHGIPARIARKAFASLGVEAIKVVEEDPYRLLEVDGIGFKLADLAAQHMGVTPTDSRRFVGAICHVCDTIITQDGHTAVLENPCKAWTADLLRECSGTEEEAEEVLGVFRPSADGCIDLAVGLGRLSRVLVDNEVVLVHPRLLRAESTLAAFAVSRYGVEAGEYDEHIATASRHAEMTLNADQTAAIRTALRAKLSIITGGPGTGKTTVVRTLVRAAELAGVSIRLMAPTGKAAKRLAEVTKRPATTIHRALEFNPAFGRFGRGKDNPWDEALIVVDESSMLDATLAAHVVNAVADGANLVLVGDVDQLPSVGPGNVLGDLIDTGISPLTYLRTVYRQQEGSGVSAAAHEILNGLSPSPAEDFQIVQIDDLDMVVELYVGAEKRFGVDLSNVQVLIPAYKGEFGIDLFNAKVQARLTGKEPVREGFKPLFVGDRVIQTKNDYELGIVNGDVGWIQHKTDKTVVVRFDGVGDVAIPRKQLDNLSPAYAVSVHKSQGSQYAVVLIVLHRSHFLLLQRTLLYTAVTRAEKHCMLFGAARSIRTAIDNVRSSARVTLLPHWIHEVAHAEPDPDAT